MELQEIRAAETLLTLSDSPTTYRLSVPVDTLPESDDEVVFTSVSWQAGTRPPRVLVDPHADTLPLHSTPMEQDPGTQGANTPVCTDYVSPVFGMPTYPTGRILPTQSETANLQHDQTLHNYQNNKFLIQFN